MNQRDMALLIEVEDELDKMIGRWNSLPGRDMLSSIS